MKPRPETPIVRVLNSAKSTNDNQKKDNNRNDYFLKNFSNFMKQIIDNKNEIFLSGDKNLVKYILSKYLNIPENDLNSLKKLSVIITNDYGLLNQFGNFLPELKLLKLNGSNILTFNDIGTNFNKIECLQMKSCHLKDLNGIICMQNLQILDIEDNEISDLIDIDMCSELKKINLRKNKILDSDNLTFLSSINNLEYIDLRDNPICDIENAENDFENNLNEVKLLIWKKEDENKIIDIVSEYDDLLIDAVPKSENNKIENYNNEEENEVEEEENEENDNNKKEDNKNKIVNNNNLKDKNEVLSSFLKNSPIKKSKIQIDAGSNMINFPIEKKNIILNNSNNNKNVNINSNSNTFSTTLIKKQPLKPIKLNKDLINKSFGSNKNINVNSSLIGKDKNSNAIKIKYNEDNKNMKINPINRVKK